MGGAFTKRGVVFKNAEDFTQWHLPDVNRAHKRYLATRKPIPDYFPDNLDFRAGRLGHEHHINRRQFLEVFDSFQEGERYLTLLHKFPQFDIENTGKVNVFEVFAALILCCESPLPPKVCSHQ